MKTPKIDLWADLNAEDDEGRYSFFVRYFFAQKPQLVKQFSIIVSFKRSAFSNRIARRFRLV